VLAAGGGSVGGARGDRPPSQAPARVPDPPYHAPEYESTGGTAARQTQRAVRADAAAVSSIVPSTLSACIAGVSTAGSTCGEPSRATLQAHAPSSTVAPTRRPPPPPSAAISATATCVGVTSCRGGHGSDSGGGDGQLRTKSSATRSEPWLGGARAASAPAAGRTAAKSAAAAATAAGTVVPSSRRAPERRQLVQTTTTRAATTRTTTDAAGGRCMEPPGIEGVTAAANKAAKGEAAAVSSSAASREQMLVQAWRAMQTQKGSSASTQHPSSAVRRMSATKAKSAAAGAVAKAPASLRTTAAAATGLPRRDVSTQASVADHTHRFSKSAAVAAVAATPTTPGATQADVKAATQALLRWCRVHPQVTTLGWAPHADDCGAQGAAEAALAIAPAVEVFTEVRRSLESLQCAQPPSVSHVLDEHDGVLDGDAPSEAAAALAATTQLAMAQRAEAEAEVVEAAFAAAEWQELFEASEVENSEIKGQLQAAAEEVARLRSRCEAAEAAAAIATATNEQAVSRTEKEVMRWRERCEAGEAAAAAEAVTTAAQRAEAEAAKVEWARLKVRCEAAEGAVAAMTEERNHHRAEAARWKELFEASEVENTEIKRQLQAALEDRAQRAAATAAARHEAALASEALDIASEEIARLRQMP
jgi:hypothetical protein